MKQILWTLPLVLGLAACNKSADTGASREADNAAEVVMTDSMARPESAGGDQPPAIDASIAPGVAFDYQFGFSLPEKAIAAMQAEHGRLCARIGVSQCRVVGLTFTKARGGEISADMTFKLDPALALNFTRDATDLVNRADGKLETSQVEGSNVGDEIVQDDKSVQAQKAELARLTAEQKIPGLSKARRDEISRELAEIRRALAGAGKDRDAKVESLATTPVRFSYEANETILGFGRGSPVQQGLSSGSASLNMFLTFVALIVGTLWPWALAGFGVWWLIRRLRVDGQPNKVAE
jgi:hypothetical protein